MDRRERGRRKRRRDFNALTSLLVVKPSLLQPRASLRPCPAPLSLLPASHIARKHLATTSLARSPQLARLLPCLLGCQRASCPPPLCRLTGLASGDACVDTRHGRGRGRTGFVGGETHQNDDDEDLLVREVEPHNQGFAALGTRCKIDERNRPWVICCFRLFWKHFGIINHNLCRCKSST